MHRVITKRFDHLGHWIVESGPWHVSRNDAEHWADILRQLGYHARVESQHALLDNDGAADNDDLHNALMNMA